MSWSLLAALVLAGLSAGWVLSRIAAHGRRLNLLAALKAAEAEVERLGYIEAALCAHPFGEGIPMVSTALTACMAMRADARRRVTACHQALAKLPRGWRA